MNNKWIVVTTINSPQPAIHTISKLCTSDGWRCVVVGDKKTPDKWHSDGVDYLSVDDQQRLFPTLSEVLPYNHYCRKNIGYLYAINNGAKFILETDDDNIPLSKFGANLSRTIRGRLVGASRWVNVYRYFTNHLIWPRGNPLNTIHDSGRYLGTTEVDCPIQQFLANGDPDVDAIYRFLYKDELYFEESVPVILQNGSWCSFNSQNTLFYSDFFAALYLPCHVSFRMTDIWRSFIAQSVLWSENKNLSFLPPTVKQIRNQHDLTQDFRDEIDGYLENSRICRILEEESKNWKNDMTIGKKVYLAWTALHREHIINDQELGILDEWLKKVGE